MDHSKETRVVAYCIEETLANFGILYEFAKVYLPIAQHLK